MSGEGAFEGESEKVGFEKHVEIENVGIGASAPHTPGGTGHSGGSVHMGDVSITALEGRHSIEFWKKLLEGTHFDKIVIKFTKQTGDATLQIYKEVTLEAVYVTSQSTSGMADQQSMESFTLAADKTTIEYKAQNAQGQLTTVGTVMYDSRQAQVA